MAATAGDAAAAAACPAYPWPSDGAQRGRKVFMQSDCTACHGMFSNAGAGLSNDDAVWEPKVAEIVVVEEAHQPAAAAASLRGGAYYPAPDLITFLAKGLRGNNLYSGGGASEAARMLADAAAACQELKKRALASPVWL
uniref:Cytochrome c domain-containing protein n=1 Tax=Oryza meridionalis TaxID=40149 RepID=A0A0E0CT05_9ORYZ